MIIFTGCLFAVVKRCILMPPFIMSTADMVIGNFTKTFLDYMNKCVFAQLWIGTLCSPFLLFDSNDFSYYSTLFLTDTFR
ncbi:hypothetical protein BKA69DRAFT_1076423 [Paraphysoderma sedebokerense]|nr:hypothetical protein BKA69DRAFT_1076423 [Paraphysoderma sedebokerense]